MAYFVLLSRFSVCVVHHHVRGSGHPFLTGDSLVDNGHEGRGILINSPGWIYFPYVWLPAHIVPSAAIYHVLCLKKLKVIGA